MEKEFETKPLLQQQQQYQKQFIIQIKSFEFKSTKVKNQTDENQKRCIGIKFFCFLVFVVILLSLVLKWSNFFLNASTSLSSPLSEKLQHIISFPKETAIWNTNLSYEFQNCPPSWGCVWDDQGHFVKQIQAKFEGLSNEWSFESLLQNLPNGTTINFVGDSLSRQTNGAFSYFCDIYNCTNYNIKHQWCPAAMLKTLNPDYVSSKNKEFAKKEIFKGNGFAEASFETFEKCLFTNNSISIVNFGTHFGFGCSKYYVESPAKIEIFYEYVRNIMEHFQNITNNSYFYRLTYPQHFLNCTGTENKKICQAVDWEFRTEGRGCAKFNMTVNDHWSNKFAKNVFQNSSITMIDYYELLKNRGDLHNGGRDCTHWNFDFEMWNGIFYLLDVAYLKNKNK